MAGSCFRWFVARYGLQPDSKAGDSTSTNPIPSPSSDHGDYSFTVSWNANHETSVNSSGGGYRVYYSKTSPVNTQGQNFVDVPFKKAPLAPTSATVNFVSAGTYYVRVIARSNTVSAGSISPDSQEISVTVPANEN